MSAVLDEPAKLRQGTCWYVYGVVPAKAGILASGWPSVGAAGDQALLEEGTVAAVVSPVRSEEFDHPGIDARVQEPEWLEAKVRAHEQVVELVLARSPVVPFRFCTIYRSQDAVRCFLAHHLDDLQEALDRVTGKVERGVKAFCDRSRLVSAAAQIESTAEGASGGRAYLERRLAEQESAKEVARLGLEVVETFHARLGAVADDAALLGLQTREQSGHPDEMVLNAAYLVPTESRALEQAVGELRAEHEAMGFSFELTGPWPPYSFVSQEIE